METMLEFELGTPVVNVKGDPTPPGPTPPGEVTYGGLPDKPQIEGVTLVGSKTGEELKLASLAYVDREIGNIDSLLQTI